MLKKCNKLKAKFPANRKKRSKTKGLEKLRLKWNALHRITLRCWPGHYKNKSSIYLFEILYFFYHKKIYIFIIIVVE